MKDTKEILKKLLLAISEAEKMAQEVKALHCSNVKASVTKEHVTTLLAKLTSITGIISEIKGIANLPPIEYNSILHRTTFASHVALSTLFDLVKADVDSQGSGLSAEMDKKITLLFNKKKDLEETLKATAAFDRTMRMCGLKY